MKELALQEIKKALGENVESIRLYGNDISVLDLINRCQSFPLFQEKKLIVVQEAEALLDNKLVAYSRNPSPRTCLILLVKKGKKGLEKFSVQFYPLSQQQTFYWIKAEVEKRKKGIDVLAINSLQNYAGNDLRRISQELKKVLCYVGEKKVIEKKDVDALAVEKKEGDIFYMLNCLAAGKRKEALKGLQDLLEAGELPGRILFMISRQFRLIFQAKELMAKVPSPKIAQMLKIHPYYISQYIRQANNFSFGQMQDIFSSLAQADLQLKTSVRKPRLVLELLLLGSGLHTSHKIVRGCTPETPLKSPSFPLF